MSGSSPGQIAGGIVGAVVGFYTPGVGPYQGFMIGYTLGGVIDPPAQNTVDGPRIDDLRVMTSSYGDLIKLVYGPNNRVSGTMIWSTDLIETEVEEEGGT